MDLSKISNSQNEHTKSEESELIVKTSADTTSLDAAQNTQTDSSSVTISSSNERQKHSSRCNDIHQTLSMLSDEPTSIIAEEADALGLRNYSMIIARTALSNDGPFTIGVHGGWGEGKTTALLCAKAQLESVETESLVTVWFNAWKYENDANPLVPLLSTIVTAIEDKELKIGEKIDKQSESKSKIFQKARKGLEVMSATLRALAYGVSAETKIKVPFLTDLGVKWDSKAMIERYEEIRKTMEGSSIFEKTFYMDIFSKLDQFCSDEEQGIKRPKIVVFIDDLDRCHPDQSVRLLDSIKLVLGQKGFVFVMAVDSLVIESYLKQRYQNEFAMPEYGERAGAHYMDKIVQLSLPLPPHEAKMQHYYDFLIEQISIKNNVPFYNVLRSLKSLLLAGCKHNPRSMVRLINKLSTDFELWAIYSKENPKSYDISEDSDNYTEELLSQYAVAQMIRDSLGVRVFTLLVENQKYCDYILSKVDEHTSLFHRDIYLPKFLQKLFYKDIGPVFRHLTPSGDNLTAVFKHSAGKMWLNNPKVRSDIEEYFKHYSIQQDIDSDNEPDDTPLTELDKTRSK